MATKKLVIIKPGTEVVDYDRNAVQIVEADEKFCAGWDAAIAEMKKEVEGYIEAKQAGQTVAPWEEWLPRLLDLLLEP